MFLKALLLITDRPKIGLTGRSKSISFIDILLVYKPREVIKTSYLMIVFKLLHSAIFFMTFRYFAIGDLMRVWLDCSLENVGVLL